MNVSDVTTEKVAVNAAEAWSRDDLLWLVGLVEGEACIDLHRKKYPRLRVSMCDRDVVGRVADLVGSPLRLTLMAPPNSAVWHAEVSGERAAQVLERLLPHLGARRSAKAAEVLGSWRMRKGERRYMPGPSITKPPGLS